MGAKQPAEPPPPHTQHPQQAPLVVQYAGVVLRRDDPRYQLCDWLLRYFTPLGVDLPTLRSVTITVSADRAHWTLETRHIAGGTE